MAREQLDDLMDERAKIRTLRRAVADTRSAYNQAKDDLAAASSRAEEILTQIEQKQGRLSFDADATPPKRGKRQKPDADNQAERRNLGVG